MAKVSKEQVTERDVRHPCEVDGCVAHLDFNNIAPKSLI